jgi:hypothetical protein
MGFQPIVPAIAANSHGDECIQNEVTGADIAGFFAFGTYGKGLKAPCLKARLSQHAQECLCYQYIYRLDR